MKNLYEMGQEIIKTKQEMFITYKDLKESQYDKKVLDQWEEQIIEMEFEYIETCKLYGDEPLDAVLVWQ